MKTQEFTTKDGSKGVTYKADVGTKVKALRSSVGSRENLVVKDGKALKIVNYFLEVENEGETITMTLTGGQAKGLAKAGDLTGRTIEFYEYSNEFGTQIGAKAI